MPFSENNNPSPDYRLVMKLEEVMGELEDLLTGAYLLSGGSENWTKIADAGQLDAWATLAAWAKAGMPVVSISHETEKNLRAESPPAGTRIRNLPPACGAIAGYFGGSSDLMAIAIHAKDRGAIPVTDDMGLIYRQPCLSYIGRISLRTFSGFFDVARMPTLESLVIEPRHWTDPLTEESGAFNPEERSILLSRIRLLLILMMRAGAANEY